MAAVAAMAATTPAAAAVPYNPGVVLTAVVSLLTEEAEVGAGGELGECGLSKCGLKPPPSIHNATRCHRTWLKPGERVLLVFGLTLTAASYLRTGWKGKC